MRRLAARMVAVVSQSLIIKDVQHEASVFNNRLLLGGLLIVLLSLLLASRLAWLQILAFDHYDDLARQNRVKMSALPPSRGLIYDRSGRLLAENVPSYNLQLTAEEIADMPQTLQRLSALLEIPDDDIVAFQRQLKRSPGFASIPLLTNMSEEQVAQFEVSRHQFLGVEVVARLQRHYPESALFAHLLGYVGRINEQEVRKIDPVNYRGTTHIGKTGIEKQYESLLHGLSGIQAREVNSHGRPIRVLEEQRPIEGDSIVLTVDRDLQQIAFDAIGDESGALVAIEPATGEVLAMVSKPAFNPNFFVHGISTKDYRVLTDNPETPLLNRTIQGQYPPGSTIKPLTALAGLEKGTITPYTKMFAKPFFQLQGEKRKYHDWKRTGHGWVDLIDALAVSSDVYFYELAHRLGIDAMTELYNKFGMGSRTGIDTPGELTGILPSRDWKRGRYNIAWYPGETLIVAIGQGYMLTTPLQLATFTSCIAMRGECREPHLLKTQLSKDSGKQDLSTEGWKVELRDERNWDYVINGMIEVMHSDQGTARKAAEGAKYKIAGKSGTAQVFSLEEDEKYNADELARDLHDHALFVAYAPVDNPQIAVAVVIEHGGGGSSTAAPIARKVLDKWILKNSDKSASQ